MNTCSTCRFLAPTATEDDESPPWTVCNEETGWEERPRSEHRRCLRIMHGVFDVDEPANPAHQQPAIVTDGSGYAAALRVLPDVFGCALWEPSLRVGSEER